MVLQTVGDFKRLPGVLDVWPAMPEAGSVTLIVSPEAAGIGEYLDPGSGDGRGLVPIGMRIRVLARTLGGTVTIR